MADITIQAKVLLDEKNIYEPEASYVIVRKVTWRADGGVEKKEALQRDGSWVVVPEATRYPDSTLLPLCALATPENPSGTVQLPDRERLRYGYDPVSDVITIQGVKYSAELFRNFALPEAKLTVYVKDGVVHSEVVEE
jgi:hypothetical protein